MPEVQRLRLPDGRMLAWDEYGDPGGSPLFHMHGTPSCRIEPAMFGLPDIARELGIRIISADRPGLGRSDFQMDRAILDWPADLIALADNLGFTSFDVLSYSGGGPYALAVARQYYERVRSVTLVSSTAPFNLPHMTDDINPQSLRFMRLAVDHPRLAGFAVSMMAATARYAPTWMAAQAKAALPPPDAELMEQDVYASAFSSMVAEAARHGRDGPRLDTALMVSDWGFEVAEITHPVSLWHGENDRNAPPVMGCYLARQIPKVHQHFVAHEGHLSLLANFAREILEDIQCR